MNDQNQQHSTSDTLEDAIDLMRSIVVSEIPDDVKRRTLIGMLESRPRSSRPSRIPRGALVGAAALTLLVLAVVTQQMSPSVALADVLLQVEKTETLRAVVTDPSGKHTLLVSGVRRRLEREGVTYHANSATGEQMVLDTRNKSARYIFRTQVTTALLDFYGMFRSLGGTASTPLDDYVDAEGRHFPGLSGESEMSVGDEAIPVKARIWSDPTTSLPVRLEVHPATAGEWKLVVDHIEFDVPLDEALFDTTIPEGYDVVGMPASQLGPPASKEEAAELTIIPRHGVGEVAFDMSREQIVAILGEPEFTLGETYLNYASRGLQLVLAGSKPGLLGKIIANPMDGDSLTRNEFPGQTNRGIRVGSTRQQIRDAHGDPDTSSPDDLATPEHSRPMVYDEHAISFHLQRGKVIQIVAWRPRDDFELAESELLRASLPRIPLKELVNRSDVEIDQEIVDLASGIEKRHESYAGLRFEYRASLEIKTAENQEAIRHDRLTQGKLRTRETLAFLPPAQLGRPPWRAWSRRVEDSTGKWVLDRSYAFDGVRTHTIQRIRPTARRIALYDGFVYPGEIFVEDKVFDTVLFTLLNGVGATVHMPNEVRLHHLSRFHVEKRPSVDDPTVIIVVGRSSDEFGMNYRVEMTGEPQFMILRWEARYSKQNNKMTLRYETQQVRDIDGVYYPSRGRYHQIAIGALEDLKYEFEVISVEKIDDAERRAWTPDWPPATRVQDLVTNRHFWTESN